MILNLRDRFVLVQMLPQVGKLKEIRASKSLTEKLMPTEDEVELYGITQDGAQITWKPNVVSDKDFCLSEDEIFLIRNQFIKMDEEGSIDAMHAEMIDRLFDGII